ncbi:DUF4297 family anti-phage-associated protein [Thorsellia anophelis]|uniref:Uncharacterized protein n=1 Tax=Thorsellia anophelis DSM 18579 TaxID=1123402 RepID=A0A1I0CWH9_9GAMM|nr:DUF4297 family anti-phage-associated protein [Thorsellia anophelis]SET24205.1 hypothetical protein SAMN02583745_01780 [Thorsellia anophelis DSM 18579]
MKDRSAHSTIKGYFYQFDKTILKLLEAAADDTIVVEGIEDIDIIDENSSTFIQCKYYESTKYNHSIIKTSVIQMLTHFLASSYNIDKILNYNIYGYFKEGQHKLPSILTIDFFKKNFLTYKENGLENKIHEKLQIHDYQLTDFLNRFNINIYALSYEEQQKKIEELLVSKIPECTPIDARLFYYPNAINTIQKLATHPNKKSRTITNKVFINSINSKDVIFNNWLKIKFGEEYYAKYLFKKYFKPNGTKMNKFSRFFIFDFSNSTSPEKISSTLYKIGHYFSHKEHRNTPQDDRFCPYILIRGIKEYDLIAIKQNLYKQNFLFNDGYPFKGSEFSVKSITMAPTADQLWKIKFIPSEDYLLSTINAISDSAVEIYDFYENAPLDTNYTKGRTHYKIQTINPFLIEEIIKS